MNKIVLLFLMTVSFLLSACAVFETDSYDYDSPGMIRGSGSLMSEQRDIPSFASIRNDTTGSLIISQGKVESLRIETDDNLLADVTTEVINGTLSLSTTPNKNIAVTRLTFYITVKDLRSLGLSGSADAILQSLVIDQLDILLAGSGAIRAESLNVEGTVTTSLTGPGSLQFTDLKADSLDVTLKSGGSIEATGEVNTLTLVSTGAGEFEAFDLLSLEATITLNATGGASVNVSNMLTATVNGNGSVTYVGSPKIIKKGTGRVVKH